MSVIYRGRSRGLLPTGGNIASSELLQTTEDGVVVDVIVDERHPEYSNDGFNVGCIRIRRFDADHSVNVDALPWIYPSNVSNLQIPLIGELVTVTTIRGVKTYSNRITLNKQITESALALINDVLLSRSEISGGGSSAEKQADDLHKFGNVFKPDSRVRNLRPFEGDILIQGRMGHSIRLGSSNMQPGSKSLAPNIILRTGQGKDLEINRTTKETEFGLIIEDINLDASSLWMTSEQKVNFRAATRDGSDSYGRSLRDLISIFDGAQIILNSDRLVLNAKRSEIFLFSNDVIYLNSFGRIGIDTDETIQLTSNVDINNFAGRNVNNIVDQDFTVRAGSDISLIALEKLSLVGKQIFFGGVQNDAEPMVGGTSLSIFLARLIWVLMGNAPVPIQPNVPTGIPVITLPPVIPPGIRSAQHVITAMGPGSLSPLIISGLTELYSQLSSPAGNLGQTVKIPFAGAPFSSLDLFVTMKNEDAIFAVEKNDFGEPGKPENVVENSTWKLSSEYYKQKLKTMTNAR